VETKDDPTIRNPQSAIRNPRRRSPAFYFFVVLVGMASVAIVLPIVYNLGLQLKPGDVAEARRKWQENGPRDYDLELMRRVDQSETPDEYRIKVRGGRVTSVVGKADGILLIDETVGLALGPWIRAKSPPDNMPPCTVDEMLDEIQSRARRDAESTGRRNFATASFDSRDGHPHRYVHRVAGTKQRLEWIVKLTPLKRETQ
jgi:hypothetical protein